MFIKNIRKTKYIGALGVATILALTSCKKEEKQQEKLLAEEIERNPETEIVNDSFNSLWIYPKREIEKNERSKRRILSKNKFTNQST